ncbi:MAG: LPS assembly lipoprotein LptE [Rhodoferax sp.]
MSRRRFIALAALSALSGCGFKLRGERNYVFDTISVVAPQAGPVAAELRRALGSRLRDGPVPAGEPAAQVTLELLLEQREKTVVGINAAGQVREFQLRIRARFRLRTAEGKELIPESEILQQRDISFYESAVLAKEVEEGLLYRDMQNDIAQQMLRRLAALSSLN